MKALVLLFNCYLLLLALLPGFTTGRPEAASAAKHCCRKAAEAPAQPAGDQNQPTKNCTPLFGCTKMQVVLPQVESPTLIVSPATAHYFEDMPSFTSAYLSDTWHPPQG